MVRAQSRRRSRCHSRLKIVMLRVVVRVVVRVVNILVLCRVVIQIGFALWSISARPVARGARVGPWRIACSRVLVAECRCRTGRCWQCGGAMLEKLLWGRQACARPRGGREAVRMARGRACVPNLTSSFEHGGWGAASSRRKKSYYNNPAGFFSG